MNILGFGDEAIAAIIVFVLGIIFTIAWQKYTEKKRRIAYKIFAGQPKVEIGEDITERVSILFDQKPVDKLYVFRITLENIGNLAVQNQQVLFEFDDKATPLAPEQVYFEPLVGPAKLISQDINPYRLGYTIDYLAKGKQVEFRFYTKDNRSSQVKLYWRNETNPDVEIVEQRGQKFKAVDDHIQRLLVLLLIYFTVPPLIGFLYTLVYTPFSTSENFTSSIYLKDGLAALKGFLLLLMFPSAKYLLGEWIRSRKQEAMSAVTISDVKVEDGASLIVADSVSQKVTHKRADE